MDMHSHWEIRLASLQRIYGTLHDRSDVLGMHPGIQMSHDILPILQHLLISQMPRQEAGKKNLI